MNAPTSRSQTVRRVVDPVAVDGLAHLLGADGVAVETGAPLPPLWHWVALARWPDPAVQGADGHPRPGTGVIPEVPLPRRMFGGGRLVTYAPPRIGSEATVTTTASPVRERTGRSGPLALVDLVVDVRDDEGRPLLEETQHLVYTQAREPSREYAEPQPVPQVPQLLVPPRTENEHWTIHTDAGMLARFSALTANPHRIHLDWPYVTGVEGYPGLVVHGPLLAITLAEAARRTGIPAPRVLTHRGTAPLICGESARLELDTANRKAEVRTGAAGEERTHSRLELDPDQGDT